MWSISKVFMEFATILLLFDVLVFLATRHVGSYLPNQGSNPHSLHWKAKWYPMNHQGNPKVYVLKPWNYSVVKKPLAKQETQVQSLGQEDPLKKEMATHSSIFAWEILWIEETSELQSMGSQKSWTWWSMHTRTHTHSLKTYSECITGWGSGRKLVRALCPSS